MRVLIAARLSQSDGGPSRIDRDDEAVRTWATAYGHEVIGIATDAGVSGSVSPFVRKGLGPWLNVNGSQIHDYDMIVASAIDRLGRTVRHLEELRAWAVDNGKQLTVLKPSEMHYPFQDGDIGSRIVWTILEQLAQWELETITTRQADARKLIRKNRAFVGQPPFGFEVVGERYNRKLQPKPELANTLRELVRRALRGDSLLSLAQWLDEQPGCACKQLGKLAGKHGQEKKVVTGWTPTGIRNWLRNPALKGEQQSKDGSKVLHRHTPLISVEEWAQVQERFSTEGRKHVGRTRTEEIALLTGVIYCEKCGGRMFRTTSSTTRKDGSKNVLHYYRCKGAENAPSKCSNMIRVDFVDALTHASFLADVDLDGTTVTGAFANLPVYERVTVAGNDHTAEIAECEDRLRELDFDAPDFAAVQAVLLSERRRLQGLPVESTRVEEVPTGQTVGDVWASLDHDGRRRYLLACGLRVLVADKNTARMEGDPSKITAALRTIAA